MRSTKLYIVASFVLLTLLGTSVAQHEKKGVDGDKALETLMKPQKGNEVPSRTAKRRKEVAKGQHPFAVVVGCSDSRVPPEIVFNQGYGDLFVIRTAGNVVDDVAMGSIEYAIEHLGVNLIMVLGHERCGAVDAALQGGEAHGHIGALVGPIKPAIEKSKGQPGDPLDNAVRANIQRVVAQLKAAGPILSEKAKKGELKIVGARYDLETGDVDIVP
jgi:carbonic anhydrase